MTCIHLLSEETINKIAAGEVIAEPSSVVKETVENALDAGASEIHVTIHSGGRHLIQITDNGCGMEKEDAELCFQRYATSKLRHAEDLFALQTMGFRGEALSSIAAISKCTLVTAMEHHNGIGTYVEIEGGSVRAVRSVPRSRGTTLEVRDLFYNVPVRRNFQKSPQADALAVYRVLIQLALAHPEVRFCLVSDQKRLLLAPAILHLPPLEALRERMQAVLGEEWGAQMRPIEGQCAACAVRGFLSSPISSPHTRTGQYFLFNGRAVNSTSLAMAVREGYGPSLPQGKYPRFVLHLSFPLDSLDVNVHPQKKEVRLRDEMHLREWLAQAVSQALYRSTMHAAPSMPVTPAISPAIPPITPAFDFATEPSFLCAEEAIEWQHEDRSNAKSISSIPSVSDVPSLPFLLNEIPRETIEQIPLPLPAPKLPPRVLSTLPGYVVVDPHSPYFANLPVGLYLLDQRAAHLRVLHDRLVRAREPHPLESHMLVRPLVVALSAFQEQLFQVSQEFFARSAWLVEPFGPSSVIIRAVPHACRDVSYEALFLSLLDLSEETPSSQVHTPPARFAYALAKRCVSMHTQLTREEAISLVDGLFTCEEPLYCPLGKPTLLHLPLDQISNLFIGVHL